MLEIQLQISALKLYAEVGDSGHLMILDSRFLSLLWKGK